MSNVRFYYLGKYILVKKLFFAYLILILGCNYAQATLTQDEMNAIWQLEENLDDVIYQENLRSGGKGDALLPGGLFKNINWKDGGGDPFGLALLLTAVSCLSAEIVTAVPRLAARSIIKQDVERVKFMLRTLKEAKSNESQNISKLYETVKGKGLINSEVTLDKFKTPYLKAVAEIYRSNLSLNKLTQQNAHSKLWEAFKKHYK